MHLLEVYLAPNLWEKYVSHNIYSVKKWTLELFILFVLLQMRSKDIKVDLQDIEMLDFCTFGAAPAVFRTFTAFFSNRMRFQSLHIYIFRLFSHFLLVEQLSSSSRFTFGFGSCNNADMTMTMLKCRWSDSSFPIAVSTNSGMNLVFMAFMMKHMKGSSGNMASEWDIISYKNLYPCSTFERSCGGRLLH